LQEYFVGYLHYDDLYLKAKGRNICFPPSLGF